MSDSLLDQAEIDALLRMAEDESLDPDAETPDDVEQGPSALTEAEEDALGEVGNIAMGAAATTLSTLLGRRVSITSPRVHTMPREELVNSFAVPYLVVNIRYTEGIRATTLLVIRVRDAVVIADLMMGNDGSEPADELDELGISAASEAMNQMVGSSATSLADVVGRPITISPPTADVMDAGDDAGRVFAQFEDPMITVSFNMKIGTLIDTEIMQIMTVETAREEAALLWGTLDETIAEESPVAETPPEAVAAEEGEPVPETPVKEEGTAPPALVEEVPETEPAPAPETAARPRPEPQVSDVDRTRLDLILDIPLKVTVILGRTRRPIEQVLGLAPGAIVELAALADEPVEILVNGVTVARGEVVVVNENFGVRITSIMSPRERMEQLYTKRERA